MMVPTIYLDEKVPKLQAELDRLNGFLSYWETHPDVTEQACHAKQAEVLKEIRHYALVIQEEADRWIGVLSEKAPIQAATVRRVPW